MDTKFRVKVQTKPEVKFFKQMDTHQWFSLFVILFILITMPLAISFMKQRATFNAEAQTIPTIPATSSTNGIPGDANGDFHVDLVDYVMWLNNYGKSSPKGPGTGDFNADNRVDLVDYVIWLNNYGKY